MAIYLNRIQKKFLPPRTHQEVRDALSYNIPVIALGGINLETIRKLPVGFSGIASISAFMDTSLSQVTRLKRMAKIKCDVSKCSCAYI